MGFGERVTLAILTEKKRKGKNGKMIDSVTSESEMR